MESKISVITPIYNSEKYLEKCIDSVLKQTYKNWELILINDGSTDGSKQICEKYAEADQRIKLINKSNGGVSVARNIGLEEAKGEYVFFLDSDDYINVQTMEKAVDKALENNYDIVFFDSVSINEEGEIVDNKGPCQSHEIETKEQIFDNLFMYMGVLWNKLIRRELFKNNNIDFNTELKASEDCLVTTQLVCHGKKFYFLNDKLYNYRIRDNSLSRGDNAEGIVQYNINAMQGMELCRKYLEQHMPYCSKYIIKVIMRMQIENIIRLSRTKNDRKKYYLTMVDYINKYSNSEYCTKYIKMYCCLIRIHPVLFKFVWKMKNLIRR